MKIALFSFIKIYRLNTETQQTSAKIQYHTSLRFFEKLLKYLLSCINDSWPNKLPKSDLIDPLVASNVSLFIS